MLELRGIARRFGAVEALAGVDLAVPEGGVFGLIGPNGAGKTTLFNIVTGFYAPDAGRIAWRGRDITGWPPHRIVRVGIARSFQNLRLYRRMTVFENVWAAQHRRADVPARELLLPRGEAEAARRGEVMSLLERCGLAGRADDTVDGLSLAEQRRLELARALAMRPDLLLLDEPAGGMTPIEAAAMADLIRATALAGRTCIVVEHKMDVIARLCDRVAVLHFGRKIAEGSPDAVFADPRVLEVYLGRAHHA
ncbi:MAG: ABC transporter ATP-binding protein [Alphaproteobacteria bacterium]